MSTTVSYKNNTLATVNNQTKTLKTAGKYMEDDITLVDISGGVEAISIVDTPDAAGGTVRTITAVDISDTTAAAADVTQGKYFYTAAGIRTAGTASGEGSGLTDAIKLALLQLASKVAYIDDDGQDYYNDLLAALYSLSSISAVFTQGANVIYDTDSLDSLKQYLVVTATYSDGSTATVPSADYTLSGTLTVGTSTITVSYSDKTTTFTVTVTSSQIIIDVTQDLQQGQIQEIYPYISTSTSGEPTYSAKHNNRVSYVGVAIEGDAQHKYTFNYTTSLTGSTNIGIQYVTDKAKAGNHEDIVMETDKFDLGWQNDGFKFVPPTDCYIWLTFRAGSGSTAVVPSDFTSVTITVEEVTTGMLLHNWDFTQSLADTAGGWEATTQGSMTRDSSGIHFATMTDYIALGGYKIDMSGKTVILDVATSPSTAPTTQHGRYFAICKSKNTSNTQASAFLWRYNNEIGWSVYSGNSWNVSSLDNTSYPINFFNGKRVKLYFATNGNLTLSYADIGSDLFTDIITFNGAVNSSYLNGYLTIGGKSNNDIIGAVIARIKIYEGDVF